MKLSGIILGTILLTGLAACSKNKDNSDPPAQLTDIEDSIYLVINWKADTRASSNAAAYRLRPLIIDDRIYSLDTSGAIRCMDLATGKKRWSFDTGLASIAGLGGNREVAIATSQDGDIHAYRFTDKSAELLWKVQINSEIRAVPVVDRDQVLVRSVDGKLRSLLVADGSQQWMVSGRVPALSLTGNSEPLVQDQLVFAGFDDGKLLAFDRDNGQLAWETTISQSKGRTEVERLVDLDGSFVLRDGVIYISAFQGKLAAVQAVSGDLLWSRQFSSYQAIAIDDDALYLSADDSHIWAIDRRTGSAFWKQDVLNARRISAPTLYRDKLVVADRDGYLHWLDKTDGKLRGRIRPSEARIYVQPLLWKNSILALDQNGFLSSLSLQE